MTFTESGHDLRANSVRLSIDVDHHEGEWLPSLLRRVSNYLGETPATVALWCGLDDLPVRSRRNLGTLLVPEAQERIAAMLGWDPALLAASSMNWFTLAAFERRGSVPAQSKSWTRGSGTRYCPECLRENAGVFYAHWRLWWSFACLIHRAILRDTCMTCGQPPVEVPVMSPHRVDPRVCLVKQDGPPDACGARLELGWTEERLEPASLVLEAQAAIMSMWAAGRNEIGRAGIIAQDGEQTASTCFRNLRGIGIALLQLRDIPIIADLSGVDPNMIAGLYDDESRIGTTPPRDALAMGALMAAAHFLTSTDESTTGPILRQIAFSRRVTATQDLSGPGSAGFLQSLFPGITGRPQAVLLRAIDGDLPPIQRLVWGTAVRREFEDTAQVSLASQSPADHGPDVDRARRAVVKPFEDDPSDTFWPPLLWTNWANPLGIDPSTEPSALQRGLADAIKIAGSARRGGGRERADFIAAIGKRLRPNMLGNARQTSNVLQQITELALYLRQNPAPINYGRRKHLPWWSLLPESDWLILAESVGEDPGKGPKALRVRRFMYLRATSSGPRDLPGPWQFDQSKPEAAEYSRFLTTMTTNLLRGIDEYLAAWLSIRGDTSHVAELKSVPSIQFAPVTWQPPRWHYPGVELAPELDDIDIALVHDMVRSGHHSLNRISRQVGRSPRHIRWALSAHPVAGEGLLQSVDWGPILVPAVHSMEMPWQRQLPSEPQTSMSLSANPMHEPWRDFEVARSDFGPTSPARPSLGVKN